MGKFTCLCAALFLSLFSTTALAVDVWAVDGLGLVRFDSAAPQTVTRVGAAAVGLMSGLDYAANGTLYGFGNTGFYSFNTATGAATLIGNPDLQGEQVLDMSWNPVGNRMEIVTALTSDDPLRLRSVDLSNGNLATLGTISVDPGVLAFGYAVSATGTRYLHDADSARMIRLDAALNDTYLSPVGNGIGNLAGMTIDWSSTGTWYHAGLSGDSFRQELWTINPVTGVGTFVGNIGTEDQFNFGDIAIAPIPEPASLSLLVLGALALGRRRAR